MRMIFIGIDPGLHGAIAVWDAATQHLSIRAMPVADKQTKSKLKRGQSPPQAVDIQGVFRLFRALNALSPALAVSERIEGRAHPSTGLSLGRSAAIVECALVVEGMPHRLASPMEWKTHHRLIKAGKGGSRALASELFPDYAHLFKRVADDGPAEAALLAKYAEHLTHKVCAR